MNIIICDDRIDAVSYTHLLIKTDILEKFMEANEGRDLRDKGNVKTVTRNVAT